MPSNARFSVSGFLPRMALLSFASASFSIKIQATKVTKSEGIMTMYQNFVLTTLTATSAVNAASSPVYYHRIADL